MKVIYLHGFASGPGSRKAQFFRAKLEAAGMEVQVPDLAEGDFENLTVTAQMAVVDSLMGNGPVRLMGSSMGGYIAAAYAARHPERVEKLVLLAPAFGFAQRWPQLVGEKAMGKWLRTGKLTVLHYGEGRLRDLGLAMYEDSPKWEAEPSFTQPAMIFHGLKDTVVPVEASRAFAAKHANARLIEMDSDHELTDVMDDIWGDCRAFMAG